MVMDATVYNSQNKSFVLLFFFGFRFLMTLVVLPLLMSFMVRTFIALNDQISYIHKRRRKFTNLMKEEEKHEIVRLSQMMESSPSLSMPSLSEGNLDMTNVSFSSSVNESMIANKKEGKVASNPLFACVQFCQDVYTGRALRYNHPCIIKYQAAVAYLDIWDLATLHDLDVVSIQDPLFVRTFLTLENGYWKLKQLVTRLEEYLRRLQLQEEVASRSGEEGSGVDGGSPLASDIAALRQIIQESNELLSKIDPIFRVITNAKK